MQRTFDLLIPVGGQSDWFDFYELMFALRSIEKYAPMVDRVFIIGKKPEWLNDNVVHLGFPDMNARAGLKDLNILEKILFACEESDISEDFIFSNDDIILLEPMTELPNYYWGTVTEYIQINPFLNAGYKSTMIRTKAQLEFRNLQDKFFDIHTPIFYNRQKFIDTFDNHRLALGIKSVYGNNITGIEVPLLDFKLKREYTQEQIEIKSQGRKFMSFNHKALNTEMKTYLQKLFPNKSKYEK